MPVYVEDVQTLVLKERKSINTLTYIIVILMAYFGPNANILGNIQLAIWQFQIGTYFRHRVLHF